MTMTLALITLGLVVFGIALIVALNRLFRLGDQIPDAGQSFESSGPDDVTGGGD